MQEFLFVCLNYVLTKEEKNRNKSLTKKKEKTLKMSDGARGRGYDGVTRRSAMDCQGCRTVFFFRNRCNPSAKLTLVFVDCY